MKWSNIQDDPLIDMGRIRKTVSGFSDNDSLVVSQHTKNVNKQLIFPNNTPFKPSLWLIKN